VAPEEGGPTRPIPSGYRPNWQLGEQRPPGSAEFHGAQIVALSTDPLPPGGESDAEIEPLFPESWPNAPDGTEIGAYEGFKRIATGVVIRR
jgi:hypothetical protein